MDFLLAKLHSAMVTQACLSNSTAILLLHLWHLAPQLQVSCNRMPGSGNDAGEDNPEAERMEGSGGDTGEANLEAGHTESTSGKAGEEISEVGRTEGSYGVADGANPKAGL